MQRMVQKTRNVHSPTLATIRMVEDTIKNDRDGLFTVARLKRALPRKVNHNTLLEVLDYLQESGKIYIGIKGIVWLTILPPEIERLSKPVPPSPKWLFEKKYKKKS